MFVAPRLQHRFGTVRTLVVNLLLMTATLAAMAVWTDHKPVLAACVVIAGLWIGINNTLITETVMKAAPVERGVASAAYSFMRFGGAAVAPWLAGVLGENISVHLPFWVGAGAVLLAAGVLTVTRTHLATSTTRRPSSRNSPTRRAPSPSATRAELRSRRRR